MLVAVLTLAAIIVLVSLRNQVQYAGLFYGVSDQDAAQIYNTLSEEGVPVKMENGAIYVPEGQREKLRMRFIEEGLPQQGYTYDIFQNMNSFGSTEADKRAVYGYQLEQNIASTLKALDKVQDALVTVQMGETSKFALGQKKEASASVLLTLRPGQELTKKEANTIRSLVERSVPDLARENIAISDTNMVEYPDLNVAGGGLQSDSMEEQMLLQEKTRLAIKTQIEELLDPLFGEENLSVGVSVKLDFDQFNQNSVRYEPPVSEEGTRGGLVISEHIEEDYNADGQIGAAGGNPGQDPNGGTIRYVTSDGRNLTGDLDQYAGLQEINRVVDEIHQELVRAQGTVKELTATVIINSEDPMTEETANSLVESIAMAVGVDPSSISLSVMPFKYKNKVDEEAKQQEAVDAMTQPSEPAIPMEMMLLVAGSILAVILMLIILVVTSVRRRKRQRLEAAAAEAALAAAQERQRLEEAATQASELEQAFNKKGTEVLTQLKDIVDKDPESVAQLLRNWLTDNYSSRR